MFRPGFSYRIETTLKGADDVRNKIWLSIIIGILTGGTISFFLYEGEPVFFQIEYIHPNESVKVWEQNFYVTVSAFRITLLSIVAFFWGCGLLRK
ncbi:hypothetical protein RYX56_00320 [Alkalihalophilus lindianensis]|uniref:Uncharacterized protein n=1 Tax=Alkalihalophilus lindianensis TaxID=1630542 RepID=A0ABU3X4J4_9BACI|nr:hypothetical protein [Alkalihalophilus lindianensis]MDV2682808.1 hypothetical protein [Alkalihalophilus lindianensis]